MRHQRIAKKPSPPCATLRRRVLESWELYLFLLPAVAYIVVFHYAPMVGAQIAFRNYRAVDGIWGSPWVGVGALPALFSLVCLQRQRFETRWFLVCIVWRPGSRSPSSWRSCFIIYRFLATNVFCRRRFTRPTLCRVVVVASMAFILLSPSTGLVNHIIVAVGGEPIFFLADAAWFRDIFVGTAIWQQTGVNAIIYLGVLTTIDPALHESAMMDGAGKLKRIILIDLPAILPTAIILLIIAFGQVMSVGFDRAYLLQTPLNLETSETLPTYIYKVGVLGSGGGIPRYSFATAIGLFNSVVNLGLVLIMNRVARRLSGYRLF